MQLGRYLLISRIASGGMADIYRSKLIGVEGFEKEFAIKKILPHWSHNQDFIHMLIDEAKVLVRLNHPNIVQVFELNKHNEIYFIVMEYIHGVDLRRLMKRIKEKRSSIEVIDEAQCPNAGEKKSRVRENLVLVNEVQFPVGLAVFIAKKICQGLSYAHEKKDKLGKPLGIVHRDISPQNILLSFDGDVKITDFGIAKAMGRTAETVAGTLKGKFSYMSPEQAIGAEVDSRTDIFAVGIILYEMVTGERCFKGKNDMETLEVVRQASFQWPHLLSVPIPEQLKAVISRALNKRCEERYQTASALGKELSDIENQLGLGFAEQDLKLALARLFADEIAKYQEWENELSHKTRIRTEFNKTNALRRFTKIFFGATRVHEDPQTVQTLVGRSLKILMPDQNREPEKRDIPATHEEVLSKTLFSKKNLPFQPMALILFFMGVLLLGLWRYTPLFKKELDSKTKKGGPIVKTEEKEAVVPATTPLMGKQDTWSQEMLFQETIHDESSPLVVDIPALDLGTTSPETTSTDLLSSGAPSEAKPEVKPEPKEEAKSLEKKEGKDKSTSTKEVSYGSLQISAEPWGRVSLAGVVSGAETPYSSRRIPTGTYNLKVSFPPLKKTVSTQIKIRQGVQTACRARFAEKSYVSCR